MGQLKQEMASQVDITWLAIFCGLGNPVNTFSPGKNSRLQLHRSLTRVKSTSRLY
jgi:hypothetical protein